MTLNDGTAYSGLGSETVQFEIARRALAAGNARRATARIVEADKDQIGTWLDRAARQGRAGMRSRWRELPATQCPLDDLWRLIHTQPEKLPGATQEADPDGEAWIWLAFAPVWRLVWGVVLGKPEQTSADRLLEPVAWVTDDTVPFFTSDPWPADTQAVLTVYGAWSCPVRRGTRGPSPKPRRRPRADLLYAQGIKQRTGGRIPAVSTDIVFGDRAAVAARLAQSPVSHTLNARFVERDHRTPRQQNRRLTRRANGFSKDLTGCEKQWWLSLAYYHVVLPHASLRTPWSAPEPTHGAGSLRRWRPVTPAMAAGITDPVWTTRELWSYRVSPLEWQKRPVPEKLFPSWPEIHHGS